MIEKMSIDEEDKVQSGFCMGRWKNNYLRLYKIRALNTAATLVSFDSSTIGLEEERLSIRKNTVFY